MSYHLYGIKGREINAVSTFSPPIKISITGWIAQYMSGDYGVDSEWGEKRREASEQLFNQRAVDGAIPYIVECHDDKGQLDKSEVYEVRRNCEKNLYDEAWSESGGAESFGEVAGYIRFISEEGMEKKWIFQRHMRETGKHYVRIKHDDQLLDIQPSSITYKVGDQYRGGRSAHIAMPLRFKANYDRQNMPITPLFVEEWPATDPTVFGFVIEDAGPSTSLDPTDTELGLTTDFSIILDALAHEQRRARAADKLREEAEQQNEERKRQEHKRQEEILKLKIEAQKAEVESCKAQREAEEAMRKYRAALPAKPAVPPLPKPATV